MKNLQNRSTALIVAAVIMFSSTIFSVHRTLGAKCREVGDTFYNGVYDSAQRYVRTSIDSQLDKRGEAANGLASVAAGFDALGDQVHELHGVRNTLRQGRSPAEKFDANQALGETFNELARALDAQELSDRDQKLIEEYSQNFKRAQNVIDAAGYNEHVREFERTTLNVFPANILKTIAFISGPELFA